jgi:hypothetical protein
MLSAALLSLTWSWGLLALLWWDALEAASLHKLMQLLLSQVVNRLAGHLQQQQAIAGTAAMFESDTEAAQ